MCPFTKYVFIYCIAIVDTILHDVFQIIESEGLDLTPLRNLPSILTTKYFNLIISTICTGTLLDPQFLLLTLSDTKWPYQN